MDLIMYNVQKLRNKVGKDIELNVLKKQTNKTL